MLIPVLQKCTSASEAKPVRKRGSVVQADPVKPAAAAPPAGRAVKP